MSSISRVIIRSIGNMSIGEKRTISMYVSIMYKQYNNILCDLSMVYSHSGSHARCDSPRVPRRGDSDLLTLFARA